MVALVAATPLYREGDIKLDIAECQADAFLAVLSSCHFN